MKKRRKYSLGAIGAVGLTVSNVVKKVLSQGLNIIAVVRRPEKINSMDHLKAIKDDVLNGEKN